jgi:hypothetical protein
VEPSSSVVEPSSSDVSGSSSGSSSGASGSSSYSSSGNTSSSGSGVEPSSSVVDLSSSDVPTSSSGSSSGSAPSSSGPEPDSSSLVAPPVFQATLVQRDPTTGPSAVPAAGGTYNLGITQRFATYRVVCRNDGLSSLNVSVSHSGSLFEGSVTNSPAILSPGQSVNFYLTVRSTTAGAVSSQISITHDDPGTVSPYAFTVQTNEVERD